MFKQMDKKYSQFYAQNFCLSEPIIVDFLFQTMNQKSPRLPRPTKPHWSDGRSPVCSVPVSLKSSCTCPRWRRPSPGPSLYCTLAVSCVEGREIQRRCCYATSVTVVTTCTVSNHLSRYVWIFSGFGLDFFPNNKVFYYHMTSCLRVK